MLAPEGWLCLGHAEPLDPGVRRFQRDGADSYFLYRRAPTTEGTSPRSGHLTKGTSTGKARHQPGAALPAKQAPHRPPTPQPSSAPPSRTSDPRRPAADNGTADDVLTQARGQADAGQLAAALALCQAQLAGGGASADLYSLLGIIHQARHEPAEALRCFRKALYLQPDHREALTHLMLLSQHQGNGAQADLLRRRLERLGPGGDA
jgi:chemotaxis protein methyltransferase WspC